MEFKEYKISKISKKIFSGGTPNTKIKEYWGGNYYWMSSGETRKKFIYTTEKTITKKGIDNSSTQLAKKGNIVIASAGQGYTRGQVSICMNDMYINQSLICIECDNLKVNNFYLLYFLTYKYDILRAISDSNSIRGSLTTGMIANFSVLLPSLQNQKKIAKILFDIDKKIELNNQINENLQKLSQELYKKWFVDFEFPNEEGKPYKSSGGKMVNSEFGLIPEGWNYRKISDVVDFINGYGFNSNMLLDNYEKDTYKVFKMGNIKIGGGVNKEKTKSWIYKKDCSNLEKFILKKGDILMCMTDMKNSATPLLGHTALMDTDNEYIVNQRVGLLRCKKKFINYPYIYILSNLDFFIDELRSRANSGVQVNLSTKEICDTKILIPNKRIHDEFNKIVEPMYEKVFKIQRENEILKNLLNILLPELMNGEIDLDNIEI